MSASSSLAAHPHTFSRRFLILLKRTLLSKHMLRLVTLLAIIFAIITVYVIYNSKGLFGPDPTTVLWLVLVDLSLLLLMAAMISWRLLRLFLERKRQAVGSRLQGRIILMFCLVSVAPTIFVSIFSVVFFNQGVQRWFDRRVATALEESVAVAEAYLEEHKLTIRADVLAMANDLNAQAPIAVQNPTRFRQIVSTQAAVRSLREAVVFRNEGDILTKSDLTLSLTFEVEKLPGFYLKQAENGDVVIFTNERGDRVRALLKLSHPLFGDDLYLLVGRFIDEKVLEHMDLTRTSVDEYQRLRLGISRVQIQFSVIFIAVALLILFAAIWAGMIFTGELVKPLSKLMKATERVKAGDLETRVEEGPANDEIATLGRAFNRMTSQLQKQREELVEVNRQIDSKRRLTEAVLSGVSAGIIALDQDRAVSLINRRAPELLHYEEKELLNKHFSVLFPEIEPLIEEASRGARQVLQREVTLRRGGARFVFLVRVVTERLSDEIEGYVVTFDDITELVTAQRNAAWSEVARRIAHEIKNPLTPIQLSLDRIRQKFRNHLDEEETKSFDKYVDTIDRHTNTIRSIIEEFAQFARMPAPRLKQANLSKLVRDIAHSQRLVDESITIRLDLPSDDVMLVCDSQQMGQVLTNVIKNAQESVQSRLESAKTPQGNITITLSRKEGKTLLHIEDNGAGFPPNLIDRITEPYVTTKENGTGLGLAIVHKVITDHEGVLQLGNLLDASGDRITGAFIHVELPSLS